MSFLKGKKSTAHLPFGSYSGAEPYVFVSYAHADSKIVYQIMKDQKARGVNMWYDEGIDTGAEWSQAIADKILNCDKLLLFVSPKSLQSHHVRQEVNYANSKNKSLLPVHIKPVKLSAGLEMTLCVFQSILFYSYKNDWDGFISRLSGAISGGIISDESTETQLDAMHQSSALLRLDEYGDRTMPPVMHLPACGTYSIGRFDTTAGTQQSDFVFGKGTKNVSRRHAVFECGDDGFSVTDLGSKAGTWVNGVKLAPNVPHRISHGDLVSFGNAGANYIFER